MSTVPGERARKSEKRRSRIVVNIEEKPPEDRGAVVKQWRAKFRGRRVEGRRRRLASLFGLGLAIIALALVVGGYLRWQSFKRSPSYTLALAVDAAERDDRETFEQLVDVEEVSRGIVPQVIERVNGSDAGLNIPAAVRRQIAQNAQVWLPGVRDEVRDVVMAETKAIAEQRGARDYPFFVRAFALSRLNENLTEVDANDATAGLTYTINESPVEFQFKKTDGEAQSPWKVTALKSDELAARVAARVAKTFPMMGR